MWILLQNVKLYKMHGIALGEVWRLISLLDFVMSAKYQTFYA